MTITTVLTHSGAFHADDVLGHAILTAALGGHFAFVRSRDPREIAAADIVFDVGGVFDSQAQRFDHHQKGAPMRSEGAGAGVPYSSAGLLWQHYGLRALSALIPDASRAERMAVWTALDDGLILAVDLIDTGVRAPEGDSLACLVAALIPGYAEEPDYDSGFLRAAAVMEVALEREATWALASVRGVAQPISSPRQGFSAFCRAIVGRALGHAISDADISILVQRSRAPRDGSLPVRVAAEGATVPRGPVGLAWAMYGPAALTSMLPDTSDQERSSVWTALDDRLISALDRIAAGGPIEADSFVRFAQALAPVPSRIGPCHGAIGERATAVAEMFMQREAKGALEAIRATTIVLDAWRSGPDPRVLDLPRWLPWEPVVFEHDLPVLYATFPAAEGTSHKIACMPIAPGSYERRHLLPVAWAGLRDGELRLVSGVPDAVFVHLDRFCGAAESRDGVQSMLAVALEDAPKPGEAVSP